MTRLRSNFQQGTLSAGINNTATTITSTAFASLPVVVAPDYLMLVLDPDATAGPPEIVRVTAHASASPSITAARHDELTAPRSHASGVVWRHVPTAVDSGGEVVNAVAFGASTSNTAAQNDTAIAAALASMTTGVLYFPPSPGDAFDHTGITLKPGVAIMCAGNGATTLNNTGTGANVHVPSLANTCAVWDVNLIGATGSGDGILVEDAMFFKTNCAINSWGNNKSAIRLDTVANPGGNGAYFAELFAPEINGQNRTGTIGIKLTGTAAGANAAKLHGGTILNCAAAGVDEDVCDTFVAWAPSISGCGKGMRTSGASANASTWFAPRFEGNTEHCNIAAGSFGHVFVFPTLAGPTAFGTDNGTATQVLSSDSSIAGSKLAGTLDLSGRFRSTALGVLAASPTPVNISSAPVTVTSTTTETALKTLTVPANSLAVGDVLDIVISGVYSTTVAGETITLRLNVGGGNIVAAIQNTVAAVTNAPFTWRIKCIVTAVGTSGTVEVASDGHMNNVVKSFNGTATMAIGNTSPSTGWVLTAQPSAATASVSARQFDVRVANKQ